MQSSLLFPGEIKYLPSCPGVYIMKDSKEDILYIGKANVLRNRVQSYLHPSLPKVVALVKRIRSIDFIVAKSDVEALLLESNLIKKYKPPFNIRLVDDENYPYIKITNEKYPKLLKVYRMRGKNGEYFGPFPHGRAIDLSIKTIRKIFPVRTCNIKIREDKKITPCLLYHMGLCSAPCAHKISAKEYNKIVESLKLFLRGEGTKIVESLKRDMERAKNNSEFEKAIIYRDELKGILSILEKQRVIANRNVSFDVFALSRQNTLACITKMSVRNGRVIYSYPFILNIPCEKKKGEILQEFLLMHPFHVNSIKIYTEIALPDKKLLEAFIEKRKGLKVHIATPRGKLQKGILSIAQENAFIHLNNYIEKHKALKEKKVLENLKSLFHMDRLPVRIEGYDISNVSGIDAVGSMVVFIKGKPDKKEYRKFRIKYTKGPNDYAMLKEVLFRRFREGEDFSQNMPDVILIDGGRGQLDAAIKIKKLLELNITVASLAKKEELIFVENKDQPIRLSKESEELKLLQRVRDESHRFAKAYFETLHKKIMLGKGTYEK